jgi:phosphate-selective porin
MRNKIKITASLFSLIFTGFSVSSVNAIAFEVTDDIAIELEGKLHYDAASIDDGKNKQRDRQIRRARVSATAKFGEDVRAKIEYDIKDSSPKVEAAYVEYKGFDNTHIKVGQVSHITGLEGSSSTSQLPFMERAALDNLLPDSGVGVQISTYDKNWTVSGSFTGDEIDSFDEIKDKISDKEVICTRATVVLAKEKDDLWHLGASLSRTNPKGKKVRFRANAGSKLSKHVISTGKLDNINHYMTEGLEVAWNKGALLLQGEYIRTQLHTNQHTQDNIEGWHISAAYALSGTPHKYHKKKGVFKAPKVKKGKKNVELVARISELNLNSSNLSGGIAKRKTVGANYYIDDKTRLMLDYEWTDIESVKKTTNETHQVVQARWQMSFY